MELELIEALNTVYSYQVVGQDNGVDTSWVFDNGTQKLGLKMAAIKPGTLKKYKPAERVAQFFLFRVSDTGKTGGAPKTIFKPLQTVSTIAHIISIQAQENKINAFVVRFPKDMDGERLIGLMQRVANKVGGIRFEQQGFYSFEGLAYGYALFTRAGRSIESFFGKEWDKYVAHKDVIEYAATFNHEKVNLDKLEKKARIISGITRSLDSQNIRLGVPAKLDIKTVAGGNDIPEEVADFQSTTKTVYQSKKSISDYESVSLDDINPEAEHDSLESIFSYNLSGISTQWGMNDEKDVVQDPAQEAWQKSFEQKQITAESIAKGESLEFIRDWLIEGYVNNWITGYTEDGKFNIDRAMADACYGYVINLSKKVVSKYTEIDKEYVKASDRTIVGRYTASDFTDMNNALLLGMDIEENKGLIHDMDKAFENSGRRIPEGTILYRGMRMNKKLLVETLKGKAFHFRTYVSTSLSPNTGLIAFENPISTIAKPSSVAYSSDNVASEIEDDRTIHPVLGFTVSMIIRDGHKVPVIIPGKVSQYNNECEVILSRGTTMRVTDSNIVKDKHDDVAGILSMSVLGADEIKLNETYDGDHLVKTGEVRKLSFSAFAESRKSVKKSKERNYSDFIAYAASGYRNKTSGKILSQREKDERDRISRKFGGELLTDE